MGLQGAKVLVTGAAGFIGYHTCQQLLAAGATVCGIDNFSPYYDVRLKEDRAARLLAQPGFALHRLSIQDIDALRTVWTDFAPGIVIHLAAQPGVRYSIDHPREYIDTNVVGTFNLLELARHHPVEHLLISSTSSVYGANTDIPFDEGQAIQKPVSLYAATKGATELIGHSYSHLFAIPATYFRFFTVYGPWGRPDMAPFKFTDAIAAGRAIDVYNNGDMARDFLESYRDHMTMEEEVFFPLAEETLAPEDWARIDAKVSDRDDPLFGERVEQRFQELREKILDWDRAP